MGQVDADAHSGIFVGGEVGWFLENYYFCDGDGEMMALRWLTTVVILLNHCVIELSNTRAIEYSRDRIIELSNTRAIELSRNRIIAGLNY